MLCCPHNTYKCQKYSKINWSSPFLRSSWLSPAACAEDRQSFCGQSGESIFPSHIYSGCLTRSLLKSAGSFPLTPPSRGAVGTPGEGLGGGSQTAPRPRASSLANRRVITKRTSEHLHDAVSADQGTDALGALWLQAHRKPLDTKIPWGGGIHRARPVACLAPLCPAVLYFCLLVQG